MHLLFTLLNFLTYLLFQGDNSFLVDILVPSIFECREFLFKTDQPRWVKFGLLRLFGELGDLLLHLEHVRVVVLDPLVQLPNRLGLIRNAVEEQLVLQANLVLELLKLEVCVVVQVVHLANLLFVCLDLLEQLCELLRVCLGDLLQFALKVVVHL